MPSNSSNPGARLHGSSLSPNNCNASPRLPAVKTITMFISDFSLLSMRCIINDLDTE